MKKKTLHFVGRSSLDLLTEQASRMAKELDDRCLIRSEVVQFLKETPWILLPDGSHYQYPAIHTCTLSISAIEERFANAAREYNIRYESCENVGEEYYRFFQRTR